MEQSAGLFARIRGGSGYGAAAARRVWHDHHEELQREMDALWRELVTKRLIDLDALGKEAANG